MVLKKRFLIADGDPDSLARTERSLAPFQLDIFTCGSALDALAILSAQEIDLFICDTFLVGRISGQTLVAIVRDFLPELPVIYTASDVASLPRSGVHPILLKPLNPAILAITGGVAMDAAEEDKEARSEDGSRGKVYCH